MSARGLPRQVRGEPRRLEWQGRSLTLREWAQVLGLGHTVLRDRVILHDRNPERWPLDRVMTAPVRATAKITRAQAEEIRVARRAGVKRRELAERYGLKTNSVDQIASGRCWK